jgi:hypothetical protein
MTRTASHVGQDGILRAGWQPAPSCFHSTKPHKSALSNSGAGPRPAFWGAHK